MRKFYLLICLLIPSMVMAHPFKYKDMVMDVRGGGGEGSDIIMYPPHGGENQNFIYVDGNIKLASNQKYCVDISRNPSYKQNNLILWTCNGGNNQKFTIQDGVIRPKDRPNECLAVTQGNYIKSEQCLPSGRQVFNIPKVCTYKDSHYRNMTECTDGDVSQVKNNDTLSSLSVVNASGTLYEHANFNGEGVTFNKNISFIEDVRRGFNDKISSLKVSSQSRSFLITSDPQLVCTGNCNGISEAESIGNIRAQYDMFNKYHSSADAVIINGDLTDYGRSWQWSDFESLVGRLRIPYYYGLGNHDMYNSYNDCFENGCVILSITKLFHHVNSKNNISDFDVNYTHGYVFPEVRETIKGSLSYSADFGDVLVIQLNDYVKDKNPLKIDQYASGGTLGLGTMRYIIDRDQDAEYTWLERQLYLAHKANKIVIVNQHRYDADAGKLQSLLDKYNVQLRFAGHHHKLIGKKEKGFLISGSSALGTYLKADIDTSRKIARIYKGVNNTPTPELIETISLKSSQNITPPPPAPIYLRVKTSGAYEAFVSLVYRTKDGQRKNVGSGKMLAGNTWEYNVPSGSTIEYLEAKNNTGLVWEPQRRIFKVDNITNKSCFSTWGTTLNSAWQRETCP
ncbi:ricin-type beta-trefoil lectin domain protein [Edwardsiella tarda]|uniref:ricin-type beta-trefoil lectin domain protein n=1 Tax=Edwardsiella tarda TaxID=636 RepID=UPI001FA730D6|nr:ricin-type beta-trefoil lectin domain protein [Edwardsiella tarda]UCQ26591.1 ricin-type beta-trefoil lectin domain protein [Edwardsiella tarda]